MVGFWMSASVRCATQAALWQKRRGPLALRALSWFQDGLILRLSLPIVLPLSENEANDGGSVYRKRAESGDLRAFRLHRLDLFGLLRSVLSRHSARRKATNSIICRSSSNISATTNLIDIEFTPN